ncbi:MAG: amino acid ABC transporter permease [Chloroflexota bacterium]|nr:amino acid ABC transporter permease [Chloroflexota bacterium]MDE2908811.1 amino acid ABC transporter permease [Chloroflexota bacterium]
MSDQMNAEAGQSIIHFDDEPARPPPTLEVGLAGWARQNLFNSPVDIVITVVTSVLILGLLVGFFDWAIRSANWFAIINNQRLFMMLSYEPIFEWRLTLTVLLAAILTGFSLAAWARRSVVRVLAIIALVVVVVVGVAPPLIEATIKQPRSYFTAGNVDIVDRATALTPQPELAFIAQAGERVTVSLALDEVVDIETLSRLAGFSDRGSNALGNAALNRLEQRAKTGETFDQMASGELTESLEERARLNIRTFTRTNDMLASTADTVAHMGGLLATSGAEVGELRYWLGRLERAATGMDPRADVVLGQAEAVDDSVKNLSVNDAIPADLRPAIEALTATLLASEQLEDLGVLLVVQLSEDFIGKPDQSNDDEALIKPSPREAAFLQDMFARLLTPQSVLDLYQLGQTPMAIAILDASSLEPLAEAVLHGAGDSVSYDIPRDGWYILSKNAAEGEEGSTILAASGIYPIVERTLSATESQFARLTDNELVVTDSRPMRDGKTIPVAVLIDNQFRGRRDLQTYLIHFIPPFFEQVEALLIPFLITVAWGFILGRAAAHLLGEKSVFNDNGSRVRVLAWSLTPLLILLMYFALLDGAGVVLHIAAAFGAVLAVRWAEAWLNLRNQGEDAEGSTNRLLIYGWGAFPLIMFGLASGIGGLSGATLGSMIGGLFWLLLMYFVGLSYRGTLGFALLVGGFFLQIAQAFLINLVWDGWYSDPSFAILLWLALAAIGVVAGIGGARLNGALDMRIKRTGFLIGCVSFAFALFDTNVVSATAGNSTVTMASAAFLLWIVWMFFSGATKWTANRILIGLLLLTFLWMQTFTAVDRWSTIYFVIWLAGGVAVFKRGQAAQLDKRAEPGARGVWLAHRYPLHSMAASAVAWLAALWIIPSIISGLGAQGALQASPDDLLPLSDKRLWGGLMITMQLTVLGIAASFPIGLALALGRRSRLAVVKYTCILYIELVRGVPLITILFLASLLVPLVDPNLAAIDQAVRAWVAFTMFSAAYLAENVRGGLQSLDRGQTEAAQAIGLSHWQTTIFILLPQALRAVIPALVGQFISLFKDTSLVFIVGLADILGVASRVVAQAEFLQKRQETFLYVAILFFVFSYIMSYISRRIEATGSGAYRAQEL